MENRNPTPILVESYIISTFARLIWRRGTWRHICLPSACHRFCPNLVSSSSDLQPPQPRLSSAASPPSPSRWRASRQGKPVSLHLAAPLGSFAKQARSWSRSMTHRHLSNMRAYWSSDDCRSHQPCLDALHDLRSQVHGAPRMWDVQAGCHLGHRSMFGEHLHEFVLLCAGCCHLLTAIQTITRADVLCSYLKLHWISSIRSRCNKMVCLVSRQQTSMSRRSQSRPSALRPKSPASFPNRPRSATVLPREEDVGNYSFATTPFNLGHLIV